MLTSVSRDVIIIIVVIKETFDLHKFITSDYLASKSHVHNMYTYKYCSIHMHKLSFLPIIMICHF